MKLIKINTDHYVVVDDSEITQPCYVYKSHENIHGRGIFYLPADTDFVAFNKEAKDVSVITHSTQPMIQCEDGKGTFDNVIQLSLQKVKELIGEVDVEKKAEEYFNAYDNTEHTEGLITGFEHGYNQALEDNKEKKYTEEDLAEAVLRTIDACNKAQKDSYGELEIDEEAIIQSLQPKTEWEVEMVDGKLKLK